jgi:hypothetical protein
MAVVGVHNLREESSNVVAEGFARKRPMGRSLNVGHFHDDVGPSYFTNVVMS